MSAETQRQQEIQQLQLLRQQLQQIEQQHQDEITQLRFSYEKKLLKCKHSQCVISRLSGEREYYDIIDEYQEDQYEQELCDKLAKFKEAKYDIVLQRRILESLDKEASEQSDS